MGKNIRVYELARELGLENKEALDLCLSLGIGVKSHSSSVEDAQADRARRKAEREHLGKYSATPEPQQPAASEVKAVSGGAATAVVETEQAHDSEPASPAIAAPEKVEPQPAPREDLAKVIAAEAARISAEEIHDSKARENVSEHREESPSHTRANEERPAQPPRVSPSRPSQEPGSPPRSMTGRPIPPPPGPPRSLTGRQIPPPPRPSAPSRQGDSGSRGPGGYDPRRSSTAPPGQRSGTGQGGRPPFAGSSRPGGGPGTRGPVGATGGPRNFSGGPRSFSGPPSSGGGGPRSFSGPPSSGGPRGGDRPGGGFAGQRGPGLGGGPGTPPPGGGRGGGRGARPKSKPSKRRSRKSFEEIEPTQLTAYAPSSAPVPDFEVIIERGSTAQELGPKLNRTAGDIVRFLLLQGELLTATQSLSDDMIELFAAEIGAKVRLVDPGQEQEAVLSARYLEEDATADPALVIERPPVVTVMGHVDHGKTKLLDRIRETNVVAQEAGGITQHIGAYQATIDGRSITFIDTPGHEAFTQMRARGARVTDIVVLVVAADDGVMPQTVEAINHAKAANVPIIVAVNKVDREDADPNRVMQQLSEHGLVPETWGGDTIMVQISALQNLGIDDLLEQILVLSEVLELRANPSGRARGVVLEANLDVGRGPVATVIVQGGTLSVGDPIVAGQAWGRVKALVDDLGRSVKSAGPSAPVQVLGFSEVASAGDEFWVTDELNTARTVGETREQRFRMAGYSSRAVFASGAKLEDLFEQIQKGETATLNLIVKADVQGSLEALSDALKKLERPEVRVSIIHRAVGGITENDVGLAAASNATIIGFNVRPDRRARELADAQDVEVRTYEIIYKILEDIESAVVGLLAPEFEEVVTGEAEVREVFRVPRVGAIAGCYVRSGVITRGSKVRFLRDGVILWNGSITSLRRFKDDVREVQTGFECGIGLSDFQDLKDGDVIETYEDREIPRG
ncbi:MAG: translation initiation factor IF-2 [Acidimicrobiales bacterium]